MRILIYNCAGHLWPDLHPDRRDRLLLQKPRFTRQSDLWLLAIRTHDGPIATNCSIDCLTAKSSTAPIYQSNFSAKQTGNYRKRFIEGDIELEAATDLEIKIHPSIGGNATLKNSAFSGGTLLCYCTYTPVIVQITSQTAHNHVCGCSKAQPIGLRPNCGCLTVLLSSRRAPTGGPCLGFTTEPTFTFRGGDPCFSIRCRLL